MRMRCGGSQQQEEESTAGKDASQYNGWGKWYIPIVFCFIPPLGLVDSVVLVLS